MYIVMGLPGAGKTTVLKLFLERNPEFKVITYGDIMFEIAKQKFGIESRDDIRKKLSYNQQRKLQLEVEKQLIDIYDREKNIILDTHCAVKTPYGYLPGLPLRLLSKLHVKGLVLITADYSEIIKRREKDKDIRKRDADSINELKEHDYVNRSMLSTYAVISGAPIIILDNSQGKLEGTVEKLERLIVGE